MTKNKQHKILVVAESIDVNDSSGTKGRVALIKNLVSLGFSVYVYHYTRKTIEIPGATCVAIKERKFNFNFLASRIERKLRYNLKLDLHKPLEKLFGFSFTLFNDRDSIIRSLKDLDFIPNLVFTFSKGGSFRPHHALLKMPEFHDRWVAYIHDPYPMHFYPRPYVWVEPGYYQKWKFMQQMSKKAKYPAFPSKLLMDWMGSYFKEYRENGVIIPHQIEYGSKESKDDLPPFFEPNKFNILHAGNLLHARDPIGLINGFELFLSKNPNAKNDSRLLLIGNHDYHKQTLQEKGEEIEGLLIKEHLPFSQINLMQNNAVINVVLEAKSEISPFLPGKFPHCIQADKPILLLGPYYSECRRLLGEDYPYYAEVDEAEKISDILNDLYSQWKKKGALRLDRPDLEDYLSKDNLEVTVKKML